MAIISTYRNLIEEGQYSETKDITMLHVLKGRVNLIPVTGKIDTRNRTGRANNTEIASRRQIDTIFYVPASCPLHQFEVAVLANHAHETDIAAL
jgi:hypothetical protein